MTNYFAGIASVENIKSRYRELAFQYHPDRGGDTETMKTINQQYHEQLKRLDSSTSRGSDGESHTYYYNEARETAVAEKLAEAIAKGFPGIRIMLVGTWIWIDGDTRPVKNSLRELGFCWHSQRRKWYWKDGTYRSRSSKADFSSIAAKYGYEEFSSQNKKRISA